MSVLAGILLINGLKYVEEIRTSLLSATFFLAFAGFVEGAWAAGEDMRAQLLNVVKIAIIALLASNFPTMIQEGDNALAQLHTSLSQQQQDVFREQIEADGVEPNWSDIPGRVSYTLGVCLQKLGLLGYQIVYWVKDISLLLLISVSPLLIGLLALSYTRSIGIHFLITSLTVVLWNIGFAIVDTLLIVLGNVIMPLLGGAAVGVGRAAVVTVGPEFLGLCLVSFLLPTALYCSVPVITGAMMRGSNVAGAAMSAFGIANQSATHAGIVVSEVASILGIGVNAGAASTMNASGAPGSIPGVSGAPGAAIPPLPTIPCSPFMEGPPVKGSALKRES